MGLTNFPNGVSSFGVPVLGGGAITTTGSIFFVDSATGSNGNSGTNPDQPFATLLYADTQCTAGKGDFIVLMPNHEENIIAAGGADMNTEGVTVLGLGNGRNRPTFTFTTTTTADIEVDAENVTFDNIVFDMTGVDALAVGIDVDAAGFTMKNCEIRMADSAGQAVIGVGMDGTGSVNATFDNNVFYGVYGSSGTDACIKVTASAYECLTVTNNHFGKGSMEYDFGFSASVGGLGLLLAHNIFEQSEGDNITHMGVKLGASDGDAWGVVAYNLFLGDSEMLARLATAADALVGECGWFENYGAVIGEYGTAIVIPEAQTIPA